MRASGSMLLAAGPLAPWGAWSLWAALSSRQWLAVALPVAWLFAVWQLAILKTGGHFAPALVPEEYNAAVGRFLRTQLGRR